MAFVRFEVPVTVTMKCTAFWNVALCSIVEFNQSENSAASIIRVDLPYGIFVPVLPSDLRISNNIMI